MMIEDFEQGKILLVDKPLTWTSFDVVNIIRKISRAKIGHAGTLDPLATGLLILCTGGFTKKLGEFQGFDKVYEGSLKFGETTPSYDLETKPDHTFGTEHITEEMIYNEVQNFKGKVQQLPPAFSAIKKDGVPHYKKARKGEEVILEPRDIEIFDFQITKIEMPFVHFHVHCSKGTYIRSLAHDFGKALFSGAHLTSLRRTKIAEYRIEDAWNLEELIQDIKKQRASVNT